MAGAALAFTCSAMVSVFAVANILVSLIFILYMVSPFDVSKAEKGEITALINLEFKHITYGKVSF